MVSTTIDTDDLTEIRSVIASVTDPEIPVLTIDDLGILRDVSIEEGRVVVTITPTYSGCPAMDAIRDAIVGSLPEREVAGAHRSYPGVDDRLDERRGQTQARGVRYRPSIPCPRGALPPLSGGGRPYRFLLRLHCLQGVAGVHQLRRAVRSLQGAVSWDAPLSPCCV